MPKHLCNLPSNCANISWWLRHGRRMEPLNGGVRLAAMSAPVPGVGLVVGDE